MTSNRLTHLAAEINAEHDAAMAAPFPARC